MGVFGLVGSDIGSPGALDGTRKDKRDIFSEKKMWRFWRRALTNDFKRQKDVHQRCFVR